MKYLLLIFILVLSSCNESLSYTTEQSQNETRLTTLLGVQDGDIVLQTSTSSQAHAIQLATHSKWTHVGIVVHRNGVAYVYEAHGPVGFRSLAAFVNSSADGKTLVKRLKVSPNIQALEASGKTFSGKPYDIFFNWDDSQIYCSELVYKMFKRSMGVEVGALQELGDLDLSSPEVQRILRQRYGSNIPYHETVVTPAAISESKNLVTVYEQ